MFDEDELRQRILKRIHDLENQNKLDTAVSQAKANHSAAKLLIDKIGDNEHRQVAREQADLVSGLMNELMERMQPMLVDHSAFAVINLAAQLTKVVDAIYLLGRNYPTLNTDPMEYRKAIDGSTWFRIPNRLGQMTEERMHNMAGYTMDAVELINGVNPADFGKAVESSASMIIGVAHLIGLILDTLGPSDETGEALAEIVASVYVMGQTAERAKQDMKDIQTNDLLGNVKIDLE